MTTLRTWVVRTAIALAALGPVGGAAALMFGNLALWGADVPDELPEVIYAGIALGTWGTLGGLGLMVASPLRLFAAIGLTRDAWWAWPLLALCALVGLADLSFGFAHTILIMVLWAKEGPSNADDDPSVITHSESTVSGDNRGVSIATDSSSPVPEAD